MISIIIPVYQEGEALLSLLKDLFYKHQAAQCVVVDASDRAEFEKLRNAALGMFADRDLVYLAASQKGRASQMNQGVQSSRGSILLFLHADTQLPDEALIDIQQAVARGEHWGRFDVSFDNDTRPYRMIASMMNWRSRRGGIATGDQAIFMTRAGYDLVNGYDDIPLMEDISISKKLNSIAPPVCFDKKVRTAARRWEQNGVYRTILLMWGLRLAYWLGVPASRLAEWYR